MVHALKLGNLSCLYVTVHINTSRNVKNVLIKTQSVETSVIKVKGS
jgi:hypothetical protein